MSGLLKGATASYERKKKRKSEREREKERKRERKRIKYRGNSCIISRNDKEIQ